MTDKITDALRTIKTGKYASADGDDEERLLGDVVRETGRLLHKAHGHMESMWSEEYRYAHAFASAIVDGKVYTCTDEEKPEVEEALDQATDAIKKHWRSKLQEVAKLTIDFAEKVDELAHSAPEPSQKKHRKEK
jgi:hypothetical protein